MSVIASARRFSGVLHFSCSMSSTSLGQQCWLSGWAHLEHTSHRTRAFSTYQPLLSQHFCCALVGSGPEPTSSLQAAVQCASGLALPWSNHAAGVTMVLQPDHEPATTGGGDGEAKLCQEWAWGMQQRSHCRAGTDTCHSFQPAACWNSWTEGSPKAWETSSGRWPAPTVSSSCLAYAKYNEMY